MSPKLILPIGPAACGKTTYWNTKYESDSTFRYRRVSADEIRFELLDYSNSGVGFNPRCEPTVWRKVWDEFVGLLVSNHLHIFLDCTNLTQTRRTPFIHCARAFGYDIEMVWFTTDLLTIVERNLARDRTVPANIIGRQFANAQRPEPWEYDELVEVE